MNILQICSDYYNTKLYQNLFSELSNNVNNTICVPVELSKERKNEKHGKDKILSLPCFEKKDRINFFKKNNKIFSAIKRDIKIEEFDIVHAHTLFTTGYIAYKIKKEFNIPYVVAIRNTDINIFLKYKFWLRTLAREIINNAEKIIFISPKYKESVISKYIKINNRQLICEKSIVIPNGVDKFWLNNKSVKNNNFESKKIIFTQVGRLDKNKNHKYSIKLIKALKTLGYDAYLNIIGEGPLVKKIEEYEKKYSFIKYYGSLDKEDILKVYNKTDIFIMPSKKETFGLVYIEAMSQGIPVLYSQGQGIDGYFKINEIGNSITEDIFEDIKKIKYILKNYNIISKNCFEKVNCFNWDIIAKKYLNIYCEIEEKK
ncbi:glycosyltransferase family 4 protein [Clostridium perfringens]|uniref:glycosyltransferase family 4 protein n=1 Tax=Clostridium perfringens TaxID=1502 RepID=UPI001A249724|nr:glycosyltransferase family 4 protein [Clostridium perfringens]